MVATLRQVSDAPPEAADARPASESRRPPCGEP